MQRLTMSVHFHGEATQPSGEPPQVDVTSRSESVDAQAANGSRPVLHSLAYRTHVTFTGEATFTETGTIRTGDDNAELDIVTVGEGTLAPTQGRGRFEGASGLITSELPTPARDGGG